MKRKSNLNTLLYLMQVGDSSFPTGAFNHSYGFETLIEEERIHNGKTAEQYCRDWLRFSLAPTDGAIVALSYQAMKAKDLDSLIELDELAAAIKPTRENREASSKTGRALLSALMDVFNPEAMQPFNKIVNQGRCIGHQAVVFGLSAPLFELTEEEAVLAFLQTSFINLMAVIARLVPLGQVENQRVLARAWPLLLESTEYACTIEPSMIGATTVGLDLASMQHERLYARICIS